MKLICIGRNYTEHIAELNNEKSEHPVVFYETRHFNSFKKNAFCDTILFK